MNRKTTFLKNSLLLVSSMITINSFSQSLLGEYDFFNGGQCPPQAAYLGVSSQPTNATFGLYSNVGADCATTTYQFANTGWNTAATIDLNEYNQFSITPNNGYELDLSYINFGHQMNGATPCTWHLRSSVDNFATDIASGETTNDWNYTDAMLTGFDNLTSAITFRFYVTSVDAISTRWRQDNIQLYGTISALTTSSTWFADVDNDGYGDAANSEVAVSSTLPNAKLVSGDCNDNDNTMYPGATEICDGKDNDCDGTPDDGLTFVNYYADADADGFGSSSAAAVNACSQPANTVVTNTDCDDNNSAVNPQAIDIPDNGVDEDCSGADATTASILELSSEFRIFPNPVNEELTIYSTKPVDLVKIYASDGTLVLTKSLKDAKVNVSMLAQGSYQLVLFHQNNELTKTLFMKK